MTEIWLQANRRAGLGSSIGFLFHAVVMSVLAYGSIRSAYPAWLWGGAIILAAIFFVFSISNGYYLTRPRLTFGNKQLRIDVGLQGLVSVPIELVEAFLLGKGPAFLNGCDDKRTETSTLIVRIAERAPEFEKVATNVRIAAWCGYYVTLRGTWTEPLSVELVNRLNQRLHDVQQAMANSSRVTS